VSIDGVAEPLAARVNDLVTQYGRSAFPPVWTAKMRVAYADALARIIRAGADPGQELRRAAEPVQAELRRLFG